MKKVKLLFASILAVATISFATVNAWSYVPRADDPVRSTEQRVYHELLKLPHYGVFDYISFSVNGSTVTLTGKTYSLGTKNAAARFVKDIPGVSSVVNQIEELPLSSFDDRIRRQALRTFADHGLSGYLWENDPDVRIIVQNGRVTLEGYVHGSGDKDAMNILANGISGVFSVQNNLIVGKPMYR